MRESHSRPSYRIFCFQRPLLVRAIPPMPLAEAHFGGFFYLWGMKPNTTQLAAIQTCIDTLHCLTSTNDITSPSHYVDTEMEVEKLELPTEEETALSAQLCELIGVIRKLK